MGEPLCLDLRADESYCLGVLEPISNGASLTCRTCGTTWNRELAEARWKAYVEGDDLP